MKNRWSKLKESEEKLVFVRAEKESAEKRKQDYEILAALGTSRY